MSIFYSSIFFITPPNFLVEEKNNTIKTYPNPTTGELTIESGGLKIESVEVFDVIGKKHRSENKKQNEKTIIDISHLSSGIYFVTITDENKAKTVKKVVKE